MFYTKSKISCGGCATYASSIFNTPHSFYSFYLFGISMVLCFILKVKYRVAAVPLMPALIPPLFLFSLFICFSVLKYPVTAVPLVTVTETRNTVLRGAVQLSNDYPLIGVL